MSVPSDSNHIPKQALPSSDNTQSTIVTIEDDPSIGDLLSFVLLSPLLNVTYCSDGIEGLEAVTSIHPDLVIMDVMLPLMSGWQVYDAIRANEILKNTKILILSVTRQEFERQRLFRGSSIDFYMTKPFDPRTLRRTVEEILGLQIWKDGTQF